MKAKSGEKIKEIICDILADPTSLTVTVQITPKAVYYLDVTPNRTNGKSTNTGRLTKGLCTSGLNLSNLSPLLDRFRL